MIYITDRRKMPTKKWLEENREYVLEYHKNYNRLHPGRQKKYNDKVRLWFEEYRATLKCQFCGEDHPACLDFHHRNPDEKEATIVKKVKHWSIERLKKEIAKCDVLCSNCHRKHHWNERKTQNVTLQR